MNEQSERIKLLFQLSVYYQQNISDEALKIYASDLSDVPVHTLARVCKEYRLNPKNKRFPLPAALLEIANPNLVPRDKKERAVEMASEIWRVFKELGTYQYKEGRERLGPKAWLAIERFGGWAKIGETETKNEPTVRAQLRDICFTVLDLDKATAEQASKDRITSGGMKRLAELQEIAELTKSIPMQNQLRVDK